MTLVLAHRGASAAHPPGNTLAAIAASAPLGADGVELDVHLTADGEVVVHHDPVLADGRNIGELRFEDLPESVPTLAQALDVCAPLTVNIEIKSDGLDSLRESLIERALAVAGERGTPHRFLYTSFDHSIVDAIRAFDTGSPTGLLTMDGDALDAVIDRAVVGGHDAIAVWYPFVDGALIDRAHEFALHVVAWTVDDPERMRQLVGLGIDALITNVPDVGRVVLNGE